MADTPSGRPGGRDAVRLSSGYHFGAVVPFALLIAGLGGPLAFRWGYVASTVFRGFRTDRESGAV